MGARRKDRTRQAPAPGRPRAAPRAVRLEPRFLSAPAMVGAILAAGLALLAWSTRNALPGVPVADDFDFLARVRLAPPIDFFDGGGFPFYWRPLTRQVYYALLGDTILSTPWLVSALHGVALLALAFFLHRIGRRTLPPLAALSFASLPLVAESARLLLVWPACAQPLFGTMFAAAAVAAALERRAVLAGAALLAGLLSYEQAAWVVPVVIALLLRGEDPWAVRFRRIVPVTAALALWVAGLVVARARGAAWPSAGQAADPRTALNEVSAVLANVDLVPAGAAPFLFHAQLVLLVGGLALAFTLAGGRVRPAGSRPAAEAARVPGQVLLACAALGALGLVPAFLTSGLWAPRHAFMPSLFLGYAVIALLARAHPLLAPAWIVLRATALFLALPASGLVGDLPIGGSRTSFPELVRLQRILDSTRRVLTQVHAFDGRGATYWAIPLRSSIAFAGGRGPQVWAGDSTFRWMWLERPIPLPAQAGWPVIAFDIGVVDPARLVDSTVVRDYFTVAQATFANNTPRVDSILAAAGARNGERPAQVLDEIERLRAGLAAMRGELALAESLNTSSIRRYGLKANHLAIAGWIALFRGDEERAKALATDCLRNEPTHPSALELLATIERYRARRPPPAR